MGYLPFTFDLSKLHNGDDNGNRRTYGKLICPGIGTFDAFSGFGQYMNKLDCSDIEDYGPIPPGSYYIVDPPRGGVGSKAIVLGKDIYRSTKSLFRSGYFSGNLHYKWFGLYNKNNLYDKTMINNIKRGAFRLHPVNEDGSGISDGCVTLRHYSDFIKLRGALLKRKNQNSVVGPQMFNGKIIKDTSNFHGFVSLSIYGEINVLGKANFSRCPPKLK